MAANSNHFGDVTRWIERVIDSCTNPLHEKAAKRLIKLHSAKLKADKKADHLIWAIERYLREKLSQKEYTKNGNTN